MTEIYKSPNSSKLRRSVTRLNLALATQDPLEYDFRHTIIATTTPPDPRLLRHLSNEVEAEGFKFLIEGENPALECDSPTMESMIHVAHELSTRAVILAQAENIDLTVRLDDQLAVYATDILM